MVRALCGTMPRLPGFVHLLLVVRTWASPTCVLSPTGTMLCCGATDYECLKKVERAHDETPTSPPKSPAVVDGLQWERTMFVGSAHSTFANCSIWDGQSPFDVAVVGVPFGLEVGYEAPGLQLVRKAASKILPYSRLYNLSFDELSVVDGQDLVTRGEDPPQRFKHLENLAIYFYSTKKPVVALGGDQSITVPLMLAARAAVGQFALIHIDKDLAIGSGSSAQALSASTAMYWGVVSKVFDPRHSLHIGPRGNLKSQKVQLIDEELGFQTITADAFTRFGVQEIIRMVKERLTRRDGTYMPAYISLDLDVLDPALFSAEGEEEVGGLTVQQLRSLLAGLRPFCVAVGADIRDISHLTDPASVRVAAALTHDLVLLSGRRFENAVVAPNLPGEEL